MPDRSPQLAPAWERVQCRASAEVAQLVERNLAKVEVAGSSPVFRSTGRCKSIEERDRPS